MLYFLIPTFLLFILIKRKCNAFGDDTFASLSVAVCATAVWLLAITEILSLFHAVTSAALLGIWIGTDLVLGTLTALEYRKHPPVLIKPRRETAAYLPILAVLLIVLALDFLTVPYNWDSMTYHLPRIMMWAQNRSVGHFATYDVRQISSPYLSEYINLHQYLIWGMDRFFNYVQGVSFCFCAYGIHSLSRKLGLSRRWQILSTIMFISMPIAFAEALNTQVDLLTTVWLIIFIYFCLDVLKTPTLKLDRTNITRVLILSVNVGLAYVSKPSVCIAMAVFLFVLLIRRLICKDNIAVLLGLTAIAGIVVAVIICPGIIRNYHTFNTISPDEVGARQLVGTMNPKYLFINFVKNICYTLPTSLLRNSDKFFYELPGKIADLIHVNLNDASISEDGGAYKYAVIHDYRHDTAINPLIVWLFLITLIINIISAIKNKKISAFRVSAALSFLAFMTLVRWEPYETRYELSFLALLCPYIAYSLYRISQKKKNSDIAVISMICMLCAFTTYNMVIFHDNFRQEHAGTRPEGYFAVNGIYDSWKNVTDIVNDSGCTELGLHSRSSYYTYPVWVMCDNLERVELISAEENDTKIYADSEYRPEAIIWFGDLETFDNEYTYNGRNYHTVYSDDICRLLMSDS